MLLKNVGNEKFDEAMKEMSERISGVETEIIKKLRGLNISETDILMTDVEAPPSLHTKLNILKNKVEGLQAEVTTNSNAIDLVQQGMSFIPTHLHLFESELRGCNPADTLAKLSTILAGIQTEEMKLVTGHSRAIIPVIQMLREQKVLSEVAYEHLCSNFDDFQLGTMDEYMQQVKALESFSKNLFDSLSMGEKEREAIRTQATELRLSHEAQRQTNRREAEALREQYDENRAKGKDKVSEAGRRGWEEYQMSKVLRERRNSGINFKPIE